MLMSDLLSQLSPIRPEDHRIVLLLGAKPPTKFLCCLPQALGTYFVCAKEKIRSHAFVDYTTLDKIP